MQETETVSILVQAGAVGIAFVALYIIYKMQNGQSKRANDVIERNTEAFTRHSSSIDRLSERIDTWPQVERRRRPRN
jgi:cell fate (sporulation/competence/biofilm development) regulator YmcA (YheA/YmcA/DUF963 family)